MNKIIVLILLISCCVQAKNNISDILCNKAVVKNCNINDIKPLVKGLGESKIFHIVTEDKHEYVLRLFSDSRKIIDRKREIKALQLAAGNNIAPKMYWSDYNVGMLMDYVKYRGYIKEDYQSYKFHVNAGKFLSKLHSIKGFSEKTGSIFDRADYYYKMIKDNFSGVIPDKVKKTLNKLLAIKNMDKIFSGKVVAHRDVHPLNLLYTGDRFWLIDWESAGIADPYVDLAKYCNFFVFNDALEKIFLNSYNPNLTEVDYNKLRIMKVYYKGLIGCTLYALAYKIHSKEEINEIDVPQFYLSNTLGLKEYLIKNIELDMGSMHKKLEFSLVLLNDFLNEVDSLEFHSSFEYFNTKL